MYCDDSVCCRRMKLGTGVGVHEANYATKGFLKFNGERGLRGAGPKNGKLVYDGCCMCTRFT